MQGLNQAQVLARIESLNKPQGNGRVSGFGAQRTCLKYYKRLHVFKSHSVFFDPSKIYATSYAWWDMVKVIGGLVVFNDYRYSPSTTQHQSKVRSLMSQLGIKIDVTIEARRGLQSLDCAVQDHLKHIEVLKAEIAKPGTRKAKNAERAALIETIKGKIDVIRELMRRDALDRDASDPLEQEVA